MADKTSITLAGEWSEPAKILIEKISDAIGGTVEPWQIRRRAKAEADALVIKTEGEIRARDLLSEVEPAEMEIGRRAIHRVIESEIQKQINIENITHLALEKLSDHSDPEGVDKDFLNVFFDACGNISDDRMQSIWGAILAGEANSPQTFSKRTIEVVRSLDKRDAELFTKFASCCWMANGNVTAFLTSGARKALEDFGINFESLTHLDTIGLVNFNSNTTIQKTFNPKADSTSPGLIDLSYFGVRFCIEVDSFPFSLRCGAVMLTEAGSQLAKICGAKGNETVLNATLRNLIDDGCGVFCPFTAKNK